ncbi:hypothetical protein SBY92_004435 [Candida maltosa Xu316]
MFRGLVKPFLPITIDKTVYNKRCLFIASIGNPEPEYAGTRHNVGHRLMNQLIEIYWKDHLYRKGSYYLSNKYPNIVLFKSNDSLMNLQGKPISRHFNPGQDSHLIILHDELQVDLGKYQVRKPGTSSRGHNGLKSIDGYFKNKYTKIGVGIGRPTSDSVVTYVMKKFKPDELEIIDWEVLPKCVKSLEDLVEKDLEVNRQTQIRRLGLIRPVTSSVLSNCRKPVVRNFHASVYARNEVEKFAKVDEVKQEEEVKQAQPKKEVDPSTFTRFEQFRDTDIIDRAILESLRKNKFETLTPIQQKSIIPFLKTKEGLVCRAKTGTGKTLAFIIPTVQHALRNKEKGVKTLVVVPTRDLALQIYDEYQKVLAKLPISRPPTLGAVMGGGKKNIFDKHYPPDIVIATPGRLKADLTDDRDFAKHFEKLTYRVYDEADRILDIGFEDTLNDIDRQLYRLRKTPEKITSLLFSATVDRATDDFAMKHIKPNYEYLNTVDENEPEVHENVHQTLVQCKNYIDKFEACFSYLHNIVEKEPTYKVIIFLPTKMGVDWLAGFLRQIQKKHSKNDSCQIYKLHGNLTMGRRSRNLEDFKSHNNSVLICTDVAARGIDVKNVTHVLQLFPDIDVASYVHKVGRTGRAGSEGKAVLFLTETEEVFVDKLKCQRGVEFENVVSSTEIEQLGVIGDVESSLDHTEEFISTLFNYITQLSAHRGINIENIIHDTMRLYRELIQDNTATVTLNQPQLIKKHLDRRSALSYLGQNNHHRSFDNDHRRGDFGRNSRYGNNGGARRYNRYDNDDNDGGFRRNDRRSKRSFSKDFEPRRRNKRFNSDKDDFDDF